MSYFQIFLLCINVINLIIGIIVLRKNPRHLVNRSFFIFVLGVSLWSGGLSLIYITHSFIFDKLTLGGVLLMFFGMTVFARTFPDREWLPNSFSWIFAPLFINLFCLPLNLIIGSIVVDKSGLVQPINGPLFPLFIANTVGYAFISLYFFLRNYQKSNEQERVQITYLTIGIFLFIGSFIAFDIVLPYFGIYQFNLLGPLILSAFVLITAYVIIRHQLMDIRFAIQRSAIYSVLISLIVTAYIVLLVLGLLIFDEHKYVAAPLSGIIVTLIGMMTIPRIERYFQKVTDRFFFKDRYDYGVALEELSTVLNSTIILSRLVPRLLRAISKTLRPKQIQFLSLETNLAFDLQGNRTALPHENVDEAGIILRVPVVVQGHTVGIFMLGPKRSGESYTPEDQRLLRTFASNASTAFEKADLYQRLKDYSKSLEEQVRERVKDIAKLEENRRQLFDDISHALQTPLTILKSGVELLKTSAVAEDKTILSSLERSSDDLSLLISDILQLARIDAAPNEEIDTEFDLSQLISDVVEYVEIVCRKNAITVTSKIEPSVYILGNKKQVTELVTNLLSNAVRYTSGCPIRTITVSITKDDVACEFIIADTGTGITPERLPHIFDRFYRGNDRAHNDDSHGLGLAIAKRIVDRHHGTIHVSSEVEVGTQMTVRFPINDSRL